ncbi:TKL protein kinase [Phytophthora megakarya]|uniref:TKL protein kinase n=1 Tax=Phytophthora megakarya TaxID=4795 RepID=A0A225WYY7_9STRA|nr:TKL protein kinase [Phytophthora megakarya]
MTDNLGRTAVEIAHLNCRYATQGILEDYHTNQPNAADAKPIAVVPFPRRQPDWFISSREVRKDHNPFSSGSFGKVYRGWWLSTRVVVKTVTVATEKERRTFHREARIWQKARHPNIVPFFGACDEGSTYFFLCEEAKNGKLLDYLYHARGEGRDLKCNQILVSKDGVAMLTDFGLSFLASEPDGEEEAVGAIRWKAPEVIRKEKPVAPNAQSDVYSFGMCVVEAVTSEVPWGRHVPDPVVKFHVTRKTFLPRPKAFVSDAQWTLVESLCAFEPSERMKLSDAIELIRGFAEEERFQERLRDMQDEAPEEFDFGVRNRPELSKATMGSI